MRFEAPKKRIAWALGYESTYRVVIAVMLSKLSSVLLQYSILYRSCTSI